LNTWIVTFCPVGADVAAGADVDAVFDVAVVGAAVWDDTAGARVWPQAATSPTAAIDDSPIMAVPKSDRRVNVRAMSPIPPLWTPRYP